MTFEHDEPAKPDNSNADDGVPSAPFRPVEPDFIEAARHVALLDPEALGFTFQLIPKVKGKAARILHGSLEMLCCDLFKANEAGDGVFVTVNETDLQGRRRENMRRIRAVWVDHDDASKPLPAFPVDPSAVIQSSPGKFQVLFIVDGLTFEQHEAVQRRMVADYGSDKNANGVPRVLRLAGSLHTKGAPFPVHITKETGARYTAAQILEAFPPVERVEKERIERVGSTDVSADECARIAGALAVLSSEDYGTWIEMGFALYHRFDGDAAGCQLWDDWSRTTPGKNYDPDVIDGKWATFRAEPGQTPITIGSLYDAAKKAGWRGVPWQVQETCGNDGVGMDGYERMGGTPPLAAPVNSAARPAPRLQFPGDKSRAEILSASANATVKGLFEPGNFGIVYGASGAGKSFFALDLAWHIAHGRQWQGRKVKRAPVLYVALEGAAGTERRIDALIEHAGHPGEYFARLIDQPVLSTEGDKASGDAGEALIIDAYIKLQGATGGTGGVIFLDTVAQAVPGDDENSAKVMGAFVSRCKRVQAATGATVIGVHHAGKNGELRGSSSIRAACDFVIDVERKIIDKSAKLVNADGSAPPKGEFGDRVATLEKVKDGVDGQRIPFSLKSVCLGTDVDGDAVTTCIVAYADANTELRGLALKAATAMTKYMATGINLLGVKNSTKGGANWLAKQEGFTDVASKTLLAAIALAETEGWILRIDGKNAKGDPTQYWTVGTIPAVNLTPPMDFPSIPAGSGGTVH